MVLFEQFAELVPMLALWPNRATSGLSFLSRRGLKSSRRPVSSRILPDELIDALIIFDGTNWL